MRVVVEAASLSVTSGGLPRYTSELTLALGRCFPDDEFVLTSDQPFAMPPNAPANLQRGGGPRSAAERRWWLWGLGREAGRQRADVVHGPDFAVPYLPQRASVLTLHDLSPWMDPHWHQEARRVRRRTPVLLEMGIATMVVTHSESVRKQALDRFRLRPERIQAVPLAAPSWMAPVEARPARRYFLFVGTVEPRKNLPVLVEAWRELRREADVDLVIAGRRRPDGPELGVETGLRLMGEVPDGQLTELYSGALAVVYPSFYEGFGLPVLEAMQCGACVIASPGLKEAGGDAAVYADGTAALLAAMRHAAGHPEWVADYRQRSLSRAREFSWERTARLTYQVYEEARKRFEN